jgi:hypothetical protein
VSANQGEETSGLSSAGVAAGVLVAAAGLEREEVDEPEEMLV